MRKFERSKEPDVLRDHAERWNRQWKELKESNPSAKFNWYKLKGKNAREWILDDLKQMTQGHCSFCDRFTVEPESIEHFRPKGRQEFYALAYTWENLFYCCGGCQTHKGEEWDTALLRPDDPDYTFSRYFNFDFATGEISPNPVAPQEDQNRATVTIELYGLDTQTRRRYRKQALRLWGNSSERNLDDFAYRDFLELDAV